MQMFAGAKRLRECKIPYMDFEPILRPKRMSYFQIQKDHMFSHNDDLGPFYLDIFDAELKSTD